MDGLAVGAVAPELGNGLAGNPQRDCFAGASEFHRRASIDAQNYPLCIGASNRRRLRQIA